MITGKNKEQFEKWYNNLALFQDIKNGILPSHYELFKSYPLEMQIGVYLAYYDGLNCKVDVTSSSTEFNPKTISVFDFEVVVNNKWFGDDDYRSRNEAYKEAFKKANELINNQKYNK